MAAISFRNNLWQARIRRKGTPTITRSFRTRKDAEQWARSVETSIDQGVYSGPIRAQRITLADLIDRYLSEVTPNLKGARDDTIRLNAIKRHSLCSTLVTEVSTQRVAAYRDERIKQVGPGTVIRELAYLSAIINHARREWNIQIENPVSRVRRPTAPPGRDRVLSASEQTRLLSALQPTGRRNPWMLPLVELALETAMRRSELLKLRWSDVNLLKRTATLHDTKNGQGRVVPLSSRAAQILSSLPRHIDGVIFPIRHFSVAAAFERALRRADIGDFRFHDLRHTAITRMATKLPNLIELAAVSGHKSLRMLQRYYHPRAEELALKLG